MAEKVRKKRRIEKKEKKTFRKFPIEPNAKNRKLLNKISKKKFASKFSKMTSKQKAQLIQAKV